MKSPHPFSGSDQPNPLKKIRSLLRRPKKRKTHRFSASVTGEDDWEVDEPQIRMSRAFAVMLVLHLVAVGGLFAFHVFGRDDREAEGVATKAAHDSSGPPPAAAPPAPAQTAPAAPAPVIPRAEIVLDEPEPDAGGVQQHRFRDGESRNLIAAKYSIKVEDLQKANPDKLFEPGEVLDIPPPHQRVIGPVAGSAVPENAPLALVVPSTPEEEVGHRDFALKKDAENPYAPVRPEELDAEEFKEAPAPRARPVKAEPEAPAAARSRPETAAVRKSEPAPQPEAAKPRPASTGSRTHVVQKGDTIYNVSKRYGLSPNEVMRANAITDPSRLQMGQVLRITVKR